jgi:hypothetical protein
VSSSRVPVVQPQHFPAAGRSFQATLDTSETLFSVLSGINACGYDAGLAGSDPIREQVRQQLATAAAGSPKAQFAKDQLCQFYKDHQQGDSAHDLAQYVSLALYMGPPPKFELATDEADLPPDAGYVLGFLPLLRDFYAADGVHQIWEKHQPEYEGLVEHFHDPVANMILRTNLYLKLQFSSYLGRRFIILLDPMQPPGEVNARNYGDDYFIVLAPSHDDIKIDAIRHTYLHYVLDPYALNHGTSLARLQPLLATVATAPMDDSFKRKIDLLVTESLIRAIEARLLPGKSKEVERTRAQMVESSMKQGFVLTSYFYDALIKFETSETGLKDTYADWLFQIDLGHEKKIAENTQFSQQAEPELLHAAVPTASQPVSKLDLAEQRLAAHDPAGAAKMAQGVLDEKSDDPGRALFVLARASAEQGDMQGAQNYFERTIETTKDPRTLAWAHIYLGRIYDIQEDRQAALAQYQAAMLAGDATPDTKTAAQSGIARPYAPAKPQN